MTIQQPLYDGSEIVPTHGECKSINAGAAPLAVGATASAQSLSSFLTALQGLVTQWFKHGNSDYHAWGSGADEKYRWRSAVFHECGGELSAILAGVPEPPTNDDEDVTRRDNLTPIAPPQPAPTNTKG